VIAFDLTNRKSFENLQVWVNNVIRYVSDYTPILVVGTKAVRTKLSQVHYIRCVILSCSVKDLDSQRLLSPTEIEVLHSQTTS